MLIAVFCSASPSVREELMGLICRLFGPRMGCSRASASTNLRFPYSTMSQVSHSPGHGLTRDLGLGSTTRIVSQPQLASRRSVHSHFLQSARRHLQIPAGLLVFICDFISVYSLPPVQRCRVFYPLCPPTRFALRPPAQPATDRRISICTTLAVIDSTSIPIPRSGYLPSVIAKTV